ncbi:dUTP diphosphatase [Candidatus Nomurabacteria bacterium]|nr:dUTP diphosphatase [Candidatus Nomurabacteria bacterium]
MNIRIKRIDTSLPLPQYQTSGAVAFDLYSRISDTLIPGETKLIPTNLIIETPPGYMLMLAARSSLAKKKGLKMANGIGIIDQDYCGDTDELHLCLHNYSASPVTLEPGERLAQGAFVPIERANWEEVTSMENASRGGFGTTGS